MVIRTEPEAFSVLVDLGAEVRFHFDERISERGAGGTLDDAVTVSPRTGDVSVGHSRSSIRVRVEGGFQPGLVYRVTLEPSVSDMFGNQLRDPFELVFSTGGDPAPTTLAGEVWDRITGEGVGRARVHAVGSDSLVHLATTDADGVFAFRYLPAGTFRVTGFEDLDRDGEVGDAETQGSAEAFVAIGDTLLVDFPVLLPDTTPARASDASALDSVTIVVEFDDFLEPTSSTDVIGLRLTREEGTAPVVTRVYHEHQYRAFVDTVADSLARLDSIDAAEAAQSLPADEPPVADTSGVAPDGPPVDAAAPADSALAADTARVGAGRGAGPAETQQPGPPARRGPPPLPGGGRGAADGLPPDRLLPGRRVVGLLDGALEADVEYQLRVTAVVNLNGLGEGGGEVVLTLAAPEPDTVGVQPDSTAVGPDSLQAQPDTANFR